MKNLPFYDLFDKWPDREVKGYYNEAFSDRYDAVTPGEELGNE
jgi:hypothetical protein